MENAEIWVMTQQTIQHYANVKCQRALSEAECLIYEQACEAMRHFLKYQDLLLVRAIRDSGESDYEKEIND